MQIQPSAGTAGWRRLDQPMNAAFQRKSIPARPPGGGHPLVQGPVSAKKARKGSDGVVRLKIFIAK